MTTTFVTGGSGFVGRTLIPALRARGDEVRALARSDSASAMVSSLGAAPVAGDLDDYAAMRDGMRGADLIIHAAGLLTEWAARESFERINVAGTRTVLAAAREAGVARFVFFSSTAVVVDGAPLVRVDETRPASRRAYPRYCASKAAAEALVLAANGPGLQTVAIRPAMLWGPGDTSMLPEYIKGVRDGRWMWVDGGGHLTSTCHVVNAIHGAVCAAERGRGGEAYYLTDGEPVVFREFMTRLLGAHGVTIDAKRIPGRLARPVARTTERIWDLLRLPGKPPATRLGLGLIGAELTFVDAKARREIGYAPLVTVEEGLRELERLRPSMVHDRK
jgi:nucleoside-diphosphate-sugar epimerase